MTNSTIYKFNWLLVLRNEWMTPTRHAAAIVDDYGDLVPVNTEAPISYHFFGWQYTRHGIMTS